MWSRDCPLSFSLSLSLTLSLSLSLSLSPSPSPSPSLFFFVHGRRSGGVESCRVHLLKFLWSSPQPAFNQTVNGAAAALALTGKDRHTPHSFPHPPSSPSPAFMFISSSEGVKSILSSRGRDFLPPPRYKCQGFVIGGQSVRKNSLLYGVLLYHNNKQQDSLVKIDHIYLPGLV